MTNVWLKRLENELLGEVTDEFLELLLRVMRLAFSIDKALDLSLSPFEGYRKNIEGFKGRYLFRTSDNLVASSAIFANGDMKVEDDPIDDWDVRITFEDAASLRSFIFSKDQDILNSILANEVEVDGNLNYIYKFGFMARDLGRRLGVA
jgi:hypothetical protein